MECDLDVPRISLTVPRPSCALGLHNDQGKRCLHSCKLATSSSYEDGCIGLMNPLSSYITMYYGKWQVKFRLTHPKKSAVARRIIIALGVIGEEAPATLDAGSDPVGQANTARTPWAALGARHGPSVCVWIE